MNKGVGDTAEWRLLLAAAQHQVETLKNAAVPNRPGVYLWRRDGEPVYVGKAAALRFRLSRHRGRGVSLGSSSLRRNVAERLYGYEPKTTGKGRQKATREQADAIAAWIGEMTVAWVTCDSEQDAARLEQILRRQWLPPLNRV